MFGVSEHKSFDLWQTTLSYYGFRMNTMSLLPWMWTCVKQNLKSYPTILEQDISYFDVHSKQNNLPYKLCCPRLQHLAQAYLKTRAIQK
jgi:hypothetical protein